MLRRLGLVFEAVASGVDEVPARPLRPLALVRWAAAEKARAVAARFPRDLIIGADTEVVLMGRALGKPRDRDDARRMLRELSGRTHLVYTAVHVIDGSSGREVSGFSRTRVTMRRLTATQIDRYVASGEVQDKAGAYAIQAGGGSLVKSIQGPFDNVVGMPVLLLRRLLQRCGVELPVPEQARAL
jgi:septum formation protein